MLIKKTKIMITKEKIVDLIEDLELSDEELLQYIQIDENISDALHVNLRGTIIEVDGWHDELHPTNHYFEKVSEKLETTVLFALGVE